MFIRVKQAVHFRLGERTYITICDAAFFRDAENIADRVPGKMPAVGDVVPGELSLPQLKDELDVDLSGHCSWLLSVNLE